jgi:hypothetical protein
MPALLLGSCTSQKPPAFQDKQGFRFTPPTGWVERAREDALPSRSGHRPQDLPLPKVSSPGNSDPERLVVRYDRLKAGDLAWIWVTVADLPHTKPLSAYLSSRSPGQSWKREMEPQHLEVSGLSATRIAFAGRWHNQDYLSEAVAIRRENQVYFITASFPATDSAARDQVRQAVAGATWN